ncbi:hypothetical protein OS493_038949 [Desmophyllum pertusum]|uniref:Uncharacterized protein n=1 Tax=Desmophyllum pertusum TaxID=174260 RepID=A0A9X0CC45_9CNID|nr:hypothetical protein OS493_038949 [Desmophyllum pertusum]
MAYRASSLRGLAVAQMVFGALMIVFGIASIIAVGRSISYIGFGIWIGGWVLITGILGYIGAKNDLAPNKCLIGCFMGFSITACILTAIMFISYCVALADLNQILRCRQDNWDDYDSKGYHTNTYCYSNSYRHAAAVGAGIGSCMLIFALVEFILALASSIYCCNAVCCNTPGVVGTTPQYPGAQGGMVIISAKWCHSNDATGLPLAGQQPVYFPQQHVPSSSLPTGVPPGLNPAGTVAMPYAGATGIQVQNPGRQQATKIRTGNAANSYPYMQTGNARYHQLLLRLSLLM